MDERTARLQAHQRNIKRYEELLKSKLNQVELRFVQQRLSEERFALAQFMSPSNSSEGVQLPDALQ
jgi:hypothetical protein